MKRLLKLLIGLAFVMAFVPRASAQTTEEDHNATVVKMNAYVAFMNRAIRASDSLARYESWVNMKKGPTGKERIIYGLYAPYDVRSEIAEAEKVTGADPKMPELDSAMTRFITVYKQLAPVLEKASKYYDRSEYKSDKMQGGKEFHAEIIKHADEFSKARSEADTLLAKEKRTIDLQELAALEKAEGKKSRWHVRNIMIKAQAVMETLPSGDKTKVDLAAYDSSLKDYAEAVKTFDDYATEHPGSFHVFESSPGTLLSKLRNFQEKLEKYKGDARKAADDLEWIYNDYNMMVSTSQSATIFSKD